MKPKAGRASAASLAVVSELQDWRPQPPDVLSEAEADLWRKIVNTKPSEWFDAGTVPLLTEYCRLKTSMDILNAKVADLDVQIRATGEMPERYKHWVDIVDKKQGRMAQLAMKMRLTQQARYDKMKAHTLAKRTSPRKPWESE